MLWAVVGIILLLAFTMSALHTTWGRNWLKQQVIIMIEKQISGRITINSIEGTLPHRPILDKIIITDRQGKPILDIDAISMHFSIFELPAGTLRAHKILVSKPKLFLAPSNNGRWNISNLIMPSKPGAENKNKEMTFRIDSLKIDNGSIDIYKRDDNTLTFRDIELEIEASYDSTEAHIKLIDATIQLPSHKTNVSLYGSFITDFTESRIDNFNLKTNLGSQLSAQGFFSNNGHLITDIVVHLNHQETGRFWSFLKPKDNINLLVRCTRSNHNKPFEIKLKSDSPGINLLIEAFADPSQASICASTTLENLDLSKINPNLPNSTLDLFNKTKLTWSHPPYIRGSSHGEIRGAFDTMRITQSKHIFTFNQQSISAVLDFMTTRGSGRLESNLTLDTNALEVANNKTTVSVDNLDLFGFSSPKSRLEIIMTKTLHNHSIQADFEMDDLAYGNWKSGRFNARAAYFNTLGKTSANASLSLENLRFRNHQLGNLRGTSSLIARNKNIDLTLTADAKDLPLEIEGRIAVQRHPDRTVAEIDYLSIRTQRVGWTATNGDLTWQSNGTIYINNLNLTSSIGRLSLDLQRRTPAKMSTNINIQNLDLYGLHEALPILELPNFCGTLSAQLNIVANPIGTEIETFGSFKKICILPESPTLFGAFQSTVKKSKIVLDLDVHDDALGGLKLSAGARGPTDPFSTVMWRRPQNILMEKLDIKLDAIDIPGVADRLGFRIAAGGKLYGQIQLLSNDRQNPHPTIWIDLDMQNMLFPPFSQPLSIDIQASLEPNLLNMQIEPFFPKQKNITIKTQHQFGYGSLLEGKFDALYTSRFSMHADIKPTSARQISDNLQLSSSLDGVIAARVKAYGTLTDPTISVQASWTEAGIAGINLDNLDVDFNTFTGAYKLRVIGRGHDTGSFELDARIDPETALPVRLSLYADDFNLSRFNHLRATNRYMTHYIDGILDANLEWSADPNPSAKPGWLHIRNASLEIPGTIPPLRNLEMVFTIRDRWLSANCLTQAGSGSLAATLDVDLQYWPSLSSEIDVSMRHVPLPVAGQTLGLDLDADIFTTYISKLWKIENNIRNAVVYLPQNIKGSYYDTKTLEDIQMPVDQVTKNDPTGQPEHSTFSHSDTMHMLIRTKEPVSVRNQDMEAQLVVDLEIYDINQKSSMTGSVQSIGGHVMLFDRKYEIQSAKAIFKGKTPPDPDITIVLLHYFNTMTLKVSIEGTLYRPKVTLSSEPAVYEQTQLLAFVLGSDPDDQTGEERNLEDRATGVASNLLLSKVQQEIKRALPIDTLRVKTDRKQGKTTGGLQVGKWITNNIFFAYRYHLGAKDFDNINEANVTYRLTKEWVLEAVYGDRGKGGLDILWVKKF